MSTIDDLRSIPSEPDYLAKRDGTIWSRKLGRHDRYRWQPPHAMSAWRDKWGYLHVTLRDDEGLHRRAVHRLVAEAFHGPRPAGEVVRHLDSDPGNNRPENLAYGTQAENVAEAFAAGSRPRGDRSHLAKITDETWRTIIARAAAGERKTALAREHGIAVGSIQAVLSGRLRRHLGLARERATAERVVAAPAVLADEMRPVPSWPGYFAMIDGTIWSTRRGRSKQLRPTTDRDGYLRVRPCDESGQGRTTPVHKMVAEACLGPRPVGLVVAHLNGDPADNRPENLAYVTPSENVRHALAHGTFVTGERHCRSRLTAAQWSEVVRRFGAGETQRSLAREYGVSTGAIWLHRKRRAMATPITTRY